MPANANAAALRERLRISPSDLPALPSTLGDIVRVVNDPRASIKDVETLISRDQALAARVLQVANSSFYGLSRRVDTVHHAVMMLGVQQIQNLATALALAPSFRRGSSELVDGPRLWHHALTTALWCERLTRKLGFKDSGFLFTAGLLHDIGLVILVDHAWAEMEECLYVARDEGVPLCDAERLFLGITHPEVGRMVCEKWLLPDTLAEAIAGHHLGIDAPRAASILTVAEYLAAEAGMSEFPWMPPVRPSELLTPLGLEDGDLELLLGEAAEVAARAAAFGG